MKRVLFIENEGFDGKYFVEPLRGKYEVHWASSVCQALGLIRTTGLAGYSIVVLDVMLPTGDMFSREETCNGMLTGLVFFERYIEGQPKGNPIGVVLITAATGKTLSRIREFYSKRGQIVGLLLKGRDGPDVLGDLVDEWHAKLGAEMMPSG